jgi:hypothetical protein
MGHDAIAEDTLANIDGEPENVTGENGTGARRDSAHVAWIKNRVEQRMKLLAKWNPKKYGDKVQVGGDADNPLRIHADVTLFDAILTNLEAQRQSE